ncbi:type II toxin-antitoxin system VapC family toxin [Pontiella sulfatireligans]|uniref:Ribonuclease VapC n=1 Tax=Pontiella sulfatireligans TaxID=2750658 RepID=A0A6C2URX2_9BACT|nr:type II toxin-antitoxin system VapC family toxin [Pontiella sulfatireligans]VGO23090.1 Ribonuclease VapC19 [Pontiella sulfatireligans]
MASPMLIDADVMIDFLRGDPQAAALLAANSDRIILSSIVVAELYAGVRGDTELQTLDSLISLFKIAPVSADLARQGGLYKNKYAKSHGVGLADAIVAATAEAEHAELKTLNTKHYPMLKGLKPPYRKA